MRVINWTFLSAKVLMQCSFIHTALYILLDPSRAKHDCQWSGCGGTPLIVESSPRSKSDYTGFVSEGASDL